MDRWTNAMIEGKDMMAMRTSTAIAIDFNMIATSRWTDAMIESSTLLAPATVALARSLAFL